MDLHFEDNKIISPIDLLNSLLVLRVEVVSHNSVEYTESWIKNGRF